MRLLCRFLLLALALTLGRVGFAQTASPQPGIDSAGVAGSAEGTNSVTPLPEEEPAAEADELPSGETRSFLATVREYWWFALLILVVLVVATAMIAHTLQNRRRSSRDRFGRPKQPRPDSWRGAAPPQHVTSARPAEPPGVGPLAVPPSAEGEVARLRAEVVVLREKVSIHETLISEIRRALSRLPRSEFTDLPALPPTPAAPPVAEPPSPQSAAAAAATAFADWCRSAGGLTGKLPQFAERLAAAVPGATVAAVYRDLDSLARPVAFARGQQGGAPAEYWLVEVEGRRLLFPMPQGPSQFRDLAPVFEGEGTPKDLQGIQPALVREDGGGFVVTQPGRVA